MLGMLGTLMTVSAYATQGDLYEPLRSAEFRARGGAGVAIVDDEQALYLNPAGLAANERIKLHYVTGDIVLSPDLYYKYISNPSALSSLDSSAISALMGLNVYAAAQATPTILLPNLGFGIYLDQEVSLRIHNQALPRVDLGYLTTNGFQAGYAYSIQPNRGKSRHELRIGAAGKLFARRGTHRTLALLDLTSIRTQALGRLAGPWGSGIGYDAGAQYLFAINKIVKLSAGAAYTDIGDTEFGPDGAPRAETIPGNLSLGLGAVADLHFAKLKAAYDYRHVLTDTDWRKRNHFGLEASTYIFSLYGGLNQMNLTYGAAIDLWASRMSIASYAEDIGTLLNQITERRWVLRLDFKLGF